MNTNKPSADIKFAQSTKRTLNCNITVESISIDLLNGSTRLPAGSASDCGCFISAIPKPQAKRRSPTRAKV